jgi:hypothetical protein
MRVFPRLAGAMLAAAALAAVIAPSALAGTIGVARAVPLCAPAKPGHMSCFAMKLVHATLGAPGARAYELASGATAAGTIGPAGGLTPADLASAYGYTAQFSSTSTAGTGQRVGIVDWGHDPKIASDLTTFDAHYGLKSCTTANGCFKEVTETGGTTGYPTDQGGSNEIALDVEAVHAVCQNCKILLVDANSSSSDDTAASVDEAVKLGATEVSNSYGGADPAGTTLPTNVVAAYSHAGIPITVSTGDDGWYGFDHWISGGAPQAPNFPSELPAVIAVGGTSLLLDANAQRQSETVWNENGIKDNSELARGGPVGAEGGGCSLNYVAPQWQQHLSDWSRTACGTKRLSADISVVGDPYTGFDTYNSDACSGCTTGWLTTGGTSLSAPIVAAMYALAGGGHGMTFPALTLYGHLGSSSLYDVTSGGNGFCGGNGPLQCYESGKANVNAAVGQLVDCDYPSTTATAPSAGDLACDAATGYDGPTGIGTPIGLGTFAKVTPTATISGPSSIAHGAKGTWSAAAAHDPFPGGSVTGYTWKWGDGTTGSTGSPATHTYTASGSRTITLTITDTYGLTYSTTKAVTVS